ncbi:nucleolysin TIA-1/TIAR, partial [Phenoliferia sp. Uapishka_3]
MPEGRPIPSLTTLYCFAVDAFPNPGPGGFGAFGPEKSSAAEAPKRAHLYVGNLSARVTEYMLQEIFAVAGPVQGVKIIPDRTFQHGGANYGFVEYYDLRAAETALQTLNGRKIFDMEIRCNWAYQNQTAKEDLTNHCHIFVGDLSSEVTDEVLQKAFVAFGSLSDARVMWDMNSGKSRGYGFLAFRDKTDAEQAIATMNGEWLGSRAIRVNWANQKVSLGLLSAFLRDRTSKMAHLLDGSLILPFFSCR